MLELIHKTKLNHNFPKCKDCGSKTRTYYSKKCRGCFLKSNNGINAISYKGGLISKNCIKCDSEFKVYPGRNYRVFCSRSCAKKEENNLNWKGENANRRLQTMVRTMKESKVWKKNILERDNYTCQECNIKGAHFHIHHKTPLALIIKKHNLKITTDARKCSELWDEDNGITLCIECHKKTDTYMKSDFIRKDNLIII
jgi:5-methylcytosine-specific restriction endonuclease McrA